MNEQIKDNEQQYDELPILRVHKTAVNISTFRLHRHSCWEVLFYIENSGELRFEEDAPIKFTPGTVICVPPWKYHGSSSDSGNFVNICVTDPAFPLGCPLTMESKCIVAHDNRNHDLYNIFNMIYRENVNISDNKLQHIRHLMICAYDIISEQLKSGCEKSGSEAVDTIKHEIQTHFEETDYTASAAIKSCGYSQNYMRQQFLEQCGITPLQYLTELRLSNAEWLITSYASEMSVSEIARRSGFSDPLYFSKVFKKRYGVQPSRYVNQNNKENC